MPLSIAIDQGLPAVPHSWAGLQFGHVDSVITQKVQTLEQGPLLINSSKKERGFAVDLRITGNRSVAVKQKAGAVLFLNCNVMITKITTIVVVCERTHICSLDAVMNHN